MVKIIDFGCDQHPLRELTIGSAEAELVRDLFFNLPRDREFHTFICEYGQTHYIDLEMRVLKIA